MHRSAGPDGESKRHPQHRCLGFRVKGLVFRGFRGLGLRLGLGFLGLSLPAQTWVFVGVYRIRIRDLKGLCEGSIGF